MDLNIGTAFWFASRGIGYLKNYTIDDYKQVYNFEENGRPLLRIGEEGARRGKGQKMKKILQQEINNDNGIDNKNNNEIESKQNIEEKQLINKSKLGSQKNFCRKEKCRKVSKPGCPFNYCKICCEKLQNEDETIECHAHRNTKLNGNNQTNNTNTNQINENLNSITDEFMNLKTTNNNNDNNFELKQENSQNIQNFEEKSNSTIDNENNSNLISSNELYKSPCKILLVGIGADEQMAGYGRHRTTFEKFGWEGLVKELHSDMARLWTRNLGRY